MFGLGCFGFLPSDFSACWFGFEFLFEFRLGFAPTLLGFVVLFAGLILVVLVFC